MPLPYFSQPNKNNRVYEPVFSDSYEFILYDSNLEAAAFSDCAYSYKKIIYSESETILVDIYNNYNLLPQVKSFKPGDTINATAIKTLKSDDFKSIKYISTMSHNKKGHVVEQVFYYVNFESAEIEFGWEKQDEMSIWKLKYNVVKYEYIDFDIEFQTLIRDLRINKLLD